jgi:ribosomal protein L37E
MSEYCHNCGKTISEDTKKLCAPCEAGESVPQRREQVTETRFETARISIVERAGEDEMMMGGQA